MSKTKRMLEANELPNNFKDLFTMIKNSLKGTLFLLDDNHRIQNKKEFDLQHEIKNLTN